AQVAGLGDGLAEGVGDLPDAVAQDVGEADEDGDVVILFAELIDQELEVDGLVRPLVRVDGDVTELVDPEVALAPVADAVGLRGVGEFPVPDSFRVGAGGLDRSAHQSRPRACGPPGRVGAAARSLVEWVHHTTASQACNWSAAGVGKILEEIAVSRDAQRSAGCHAPVASALTPVYGGCRAAV